MSTHTVFNKRPQKCVPFASFLPHEWKVCAAHTINKHVTCKHSFLFLSMYLNTCYGHQSLQPQQAKCLHLIPATAAALQSVSYQLSLHFAVASTVRPFFDIQHYPALRFAELKARKRRKRAAWASDTKESGCWDIVSWLQMKALLSGNDHMMAALCQKSRP